MRRIFAALQLVAGALAGLVAVLYVLSRLLTDRTHATQYLYWLPAAGYAAALLLCLLGAWVAGLIAPPPRGPHPRGTKRERRRARAWTRRLPALALAGVVIHVLIAEWHAWRYIAPVGPAPAGRSIRVMHWNMTYAVPYWWEKYIAAIKTAPRPDVLIVTNPTLWDDLDQLAEALGPEYTATRAGIFAVFTRFAVEQRTAVSLKIPALPGRTAKPPGMDPDGAVPETDFLPEWSPIPRMGSNVYDPGHALCVTLDTRAVLQAPLVIWALDMPSQPRAWRMEQARGAAARLNALVGLPAHHAEVFAEPDIVLGDFNTPRGSASLALLSRGFPHAFDLAGRGPVATWPSRPALFHIDHIFVCPSWRAWSYRTLNLGLSEHHAQVAEIGR